ncbi:MAG: MBL fold metallo-hydrolase, partial [Kofleriaceae bacterium]
MFRTHELWLLLAVCGSACHSRASIPAPTGAPPAPRAPIALTYLGVAGWQLEAADKVVITDPYLSRPADAEAPLVPDAAAIAAHTPARADLVLVGHSHHDHLLDAPSVALRTGAPLLGSLSTIRVGRASGLDDDHLIAVAGGDDLAFAGFSVRAIPSLHSRIGDRSLFAEIAADPKLPMPAAQYRDGGTLAYLIRIAGHEVLVLDTANFGADSFSQSNKLFSPNALLYEGSDGLQGTSISAATRNLNWN